MQRLPVSVLAVSLGLALATPAHACGEGLFNMGQGLRYQGYLAPRPATVLVYDDATMEPQREALYAGLQKAGHRVTVVTDAGALSNAMAGERYDVIIASFADADAIATSAAGISMQPRLLPVVHRNERSEPALRRFPLYVFDNASLGQYLRVINQVLTLRAP